MAYTFLPVRTNYFPPSPPYLAGLSGLGLWGVGLGDYAAEKAAYDKAYSQWKTNHLLWENERHYYEVNLARYNTAVAAATAAYSKALTAYKFSKAAWDAEYAEYLKKIDIYNAQYAGIKRDNTTKSLSIARSSGITLPQSYWDRGACLTQAEHDNYVRTCSTVKGLMGTGLGSADPNCAYKLLPVCAFPAKPTIRAQPQPPTGVVLPTMPKPLRAEPKPPTPPATQPVTTTTTSSGGGGGGGGSPVTTLDPNVPTVPEETPQDDSRRGMIMNGLILVAVLGGGYLVYRTLKKPKAQAA